MGTFTQVNAITSSIESTLHLPAEGVGIALAILVELLPLKELARFQKWQKKWCQLWRFLI